MPCSSDYLEPNIREKELQRTARLYAWVLTTLGQPVPAAVQHEADNIYARLDYVPSLCAQLKALTPEHREALVYNAHDETSRDLANWWETHKREDRKRETREREAKRDAALRRSALDKLTAEERRALNL